ncbi:hypothetical protein D3C81_1497950 [compost metagenome]
MHLERRALVLVGTDETPVTKDPEVDLLLRQRQLKRLVLHACAGSLGTQYGWQHIGFDEFDIDVEAGKPNPAQPAAGLHLLAEC